MTTLDAAESMSHIKGASGVTRATTKQKRDAEPLPPVLVAVLLVAPSVAAALFFVWTHVATVRLGYELSAEAEAHRVLTEENRGLRIEVASLKSPDRLKRLATDKYRLVPASPSQIVRIADEGRR